MRCVLTWSKFMCVLKWNDTQIGLSVQLIRYVGGIMGDDDSPLSERVESVAAVLSGALDQGELGTRREEISYLNYWERANLAFSLS